MNAMADKAITLNPFAVPWLLPLLVVVALGVGALAGLYPAFVLSRHEPAHVLKASGRTGTGGGASDLLRRGLVVAQFGISIALIAGTFVAASQLEYLRSARLGFDAEQVVMVPILRTPAIQQYDAIKGALLEHRGVQAVTISEDVLGSKYQTNTYLPEGFADPIQFPRMLVHDDFAKTFGIQMVAGRDYQLGRDPGPGVIINEAMVQRLGWESAEDAVGRSMGPAGQNGELQRRIVGVTEDFHFASLHQSITPFVFDRMNNGMANFFGRYLAIRIAPDDVRGTLADIESTWKTFLPDRPFEYLFVDQELEPALPRRGEPEPRRRGVLRPRHPDRVPRRVRARGVRGGAAEEGDRHPQSARRERARPHRAAIERLRPARARGLRRGRAGDVLRREAVARGVRLPGAGRAEPVPRRGPARARDRARDGELPRRPRRHREPDLDAPR